MTHSVKCPKCQTKITDQEEIEFVEAMGYCLRCDHILTDIDPLDNLTDEEREEYIDEFCEKQ